MACRCGIRGLKPEAMSPLVETIAFIFGLIALGYISAWAGLLRQEIGEALSQFAVGIAVPLLLFRTMAGADFGSSVPTMLWLSYFSAIAITWIVAQLTVGRVFGRERQAAVVGGLTASFSNLVLLGVPFMFGIYGQSGFETLLLIITIHLPIMIGASIILFIWLGEAGAPGGFVAALGEFARNMVSNPLIVGIAAGLAWRFGGLDMPPLMARLVDALANVAGPVALFAIGLELRRYGITGDVRPAVVLAALKLFMMPALALAAAILTGLPPASAKVVVAAASLPSGVNPYLIATRFGTGQRLASNAMTIGTGCAVVTTAFWLWVAEWVLG